MALAEQVWPGQIQMRPKGHSLLGTPWQYLRAPGVKAWGPARAWAGEPETWLGGAHRVPLGFSHPWLIYYDAEIRLQSGGKPS